MGAHRRRRLAAVAALGAGSMLALTALAALNLVVFRLLATDRCALGGCTVAAQVAGERSTVATVAAGPFVGLLAQGDVVVVTGIVAVVCTATGWWLGRRSPTTRLGAGDGDALATVASWLRVPAALLVATYVAAAAAFWPALELLEGLSAAP